ncbi:GPN-loop GTPase 3 isoform X2 [Myxocyprinus asiaticus]|uniref:GPN-loop GTPase 3 isoform X2 n=1 Tax=Myxocyprinus asiaticus TaxID=70543 RepID=UPI002221C2BA|nr:GPN-loop GTPase 3 isoform X2 [Myxocyprinus asiaticus]
MPRYAQLVMGPAGSGKSTYCSTMVEHCQALNRSVQVVNLDPAAEHFEYPVMAGQIELYTHLPVMKQLVEQLQQWEFRVCGIFLVDSQFMVETFKFISGVMAALSAMVMLEIPQVNIMTKMDLLSPKAKKEIEKYLDPDMYSMMEDNSVALRSKKFSKLTKAICGLIDDYSMVRFLPFDRTDEEGINIVLQNIDFSIQYGEDLEFKEPKEVDEEPSNTNFDEFFQDKVDS